MMNYCHIFLMEGFLEKVFISVLSEHISSCACTLSENMFMHQHYVSSGHDIKWIHFQNFVGNVSFD